MDTGTTKQGAATEVADAAVQRTIADAAGAVDAAERRAQEVLTDGRGDWLVERLREAKRVLQELLSTDAKPPAGVGAVRERRGRLAGHPTVSFHAVPGGRISLHDEARDQAIGHVTKHVGSILNGDGPGVQWKAAYFGPMPEGESDEDDYVAGARTPGYAVEMLMGIYKERVGKVTEAQREIDEWADAQARAGAQAAAQPETGGEAAAGA